MNHKELHLLYTIRDELEQVEQLHHQIRSLCQQLERQRSVNCLQTSTDAAKPQMEYARSPDTCIHTSRSIPNHRQHDFAKKAQSAEDLLAAWYCQEDERLIRLSKLPGLPISYKNKEAVNFLIAYIECGLANTISDAILLYDREIRLPKEKTNSS